MRPETSGLASGPIPAFASHFSGRLLRMLEPRTTSKYRFLVELWIDTPFVGPRQVGSEYQINSTTDLPASERYGVATVTLASGVCDI